jgi:hypothetical protein
MARSGGLSPGERRLNGNIGEYRCDFGVFAGWSAAPLGWMG